LVISLGLYLSTHAHSASYINQPIKKMKRIFDIIIAIILLAILSPILFISIVLIFLTEGLPIFYVSKRIVAFKGEVKIYKFRSMYKDANSSKYNLDQYMRSGYLDIPLSSNVYTPIGRVLERFQIVEMPQLINILKGDMSFVGNRPLPQSNIELMIKLNMPYECRFQSPSGITGITQIIGKLNLSNTQRLQLECDYSDIYLNGKILLLDFFIFITTIYVVLFSKGISYDTAQKYIKYTK
jgi:lipopolysaccharide/colanic/teichoic acid biosynthesis glycosyltransferase